MLTLKHKNTMANFKMTKKIDNLGNSFFSLQKTDKSFIFRPYKKCEDRPNNRPDKVFIPDYEDVADTICVMVANQLGLDESQVGLSSLFVEDLGADSLDLVELVMALEEEFYVNFPEEDAVMMQTVENAVDYVYVQLTEDDPGDDPEDDHDPEDHPAFPFDPGFPEDHPGFINLPEEDGDFPKEEKEGSND